MMYFIVQPVNHGKYREEESQQTRELPTLLFSISIVFSLVVFKDMIPQCHQTPSLVFVLTERPRAAEMSCRGFEHGY